MRNMLIYKTFVTERKRTAIERQDYYVKTTRVVLDSCGTNTGGQAIRESKNVHLQL